jgi:tRNA (guanosine-2'-O-)-methyltransferase
MSRTTLRIKADKAKELRCKNLIVVLENPKNLGNIGSVLRNIDALGAEKLYIVDGFNLIPDTWDKVRKSGKLNKVSVSASKWVYVHRFKTTEECLAHLQKNLFVSVVTSPHTKGKENYILHKGTYTQKRLAVWFGNETNGVTDEVVNKSKFCINIPMAGIIESLNLATTTGIVLYEITKQRRNFSDFRTKMKQLDQYEKQSEKNFLKWKAEIK